MGSSEGSLNQDTVFSILSNSRRRYVLYYLKQRSEPIQLTKLAEHVAAWENETDVDSLEPEERKRMYVSLYQTHIPKLAETGMVNYDKDAGTVEIAEEANAVDEYFPESEHNIPWQLIYLTEALVGLLTLGLMTVFGAINRFRLLLVLAILILFGATAVAHTLYRWRKSSVSAESYPFEE